MANRQLYFDATPISYATYANNKTAVLLGFGTEDDLVDRKAHSEAFLRALRPTSGGAPLHPGRAGAGW